MLGRSQVIGNKWSFLLLKSRRFLYEFHMPIYLRGARSPPRGPPHAALKRFLARGRVPRKDLYLMLLRNCYVDVFSVGGKCLWKNSMWDFAQFKHGGSISLPTHFVPCCVQYLVQYFGQKTGSDACFLPKQQRLHETIKDDAKKMRWNWYYPFMYTVYANAF